MVVDYVQKWRRKLFCTCDHIKKELKLDVSRAHLDTEALRSLGDALLSNDVLQTLIVRSAALPVQQLRELGVSEEEHLFQLVS